MAAERDRWPLWFPVGLGIGIACYFGLTFEPPIWIGAGATLIFLVGWLWIRCSSIESSGIDIAAMAAIAIALGFSAAQFRTSIVAQPAIDREIGPVYVTGVIDDVDIRPDGIRLTIADVAIDGEQAADKPSRVRVRFRGRQPTVAVGDRVVARSVLLPPPPPSVPGGFDFQRQSFFRGLGAVGYGLGPIEIVDEGAEGGWAILASLRAAVIERIKAHLHGDTAAVAIALMTGERGAIDGSLMGSIRDSGLAHLLAISGLHIGLVAGVVFFGARAALASIPVVALNVPIKKVAAVLAILGAAGYALLAGATVPTQRAFLMIALVLLGVLIDRRGLSMRTVAWAATVILLLAPESLVTASFQLSFAAVTCLIAMYETATIKTSEQQGFPQRTFTYVGGVATTTVIASLATAPYVIYHFNRLAAYGLAANIVAVPITALWVMPLAVAAFALMPFGLEALALIPMSWGIEAVVMVGRSVSTWPGSVSLVPPMPTWGLASITLGGLWLCLWQRRWRWLGTVGLVLGLAAAITNRPADVLVDASGKLVAVRMADGSLALSTLRGHRFQRERWLSRNGEREPSVIWPEGGLSDDGRLACDSLGCTYQIGSHNIAFVRRPEAILEDCAVADIVVSTVRLPQDCRSQTEVVDRWDLWNGGVHAIWIDSNSARTTSVAAIRGNRPWVVKPKRR